MTDLLAADFTKYVRRHFYPDIEQTSIRGGACSFKARQGLFSDGASDYSLTTEGPRRPTGKNRAAADILAVTHCSRVPGVKRNDCFNQGSDALC